MMVGRQSPRALVAMLLAGAALVPLLAPAFTPGPSTAAPQEAVPPASPWRQAASLRGALEAERPEPASEEASPFLRLGGAASLLAALVVALAPVSEAQAAKGGGRMGGSAPARRPPPARAAPRPANKTTVINKTTYVMPPAPPPVVVAPPVSPFGMGFGAPVIVAPPPTIGDVIVGAAVSSAINSAVPRGPSFQDRMMENQQRQDERQIDKQAAQIDELSRELRELKK